MYYAVQAGLTGKPYQAMNVWENRAIIHGGVTGQGNSDPSRITIIDSNVADITGILEKWNEV